MTEQLQDRRFRLPPFEARSVVLQHGQTVDWGLQMLNVPEVWRHSRGRGAKVAVLDTGCDLHHPDLVGAVHAFTSFVRGRASHNVVDRNGHGTHCCGVIGARDNDQGIIGIAPECRLLVGQCLDDGGSGEIGWIIAAGDWAVDDMGCHVISMSLGSPGNDPAFDEAVRRWAAAGVCVICAAGNTGRHQVEYPAGYDDTIGVGAVGRDGRRAPFSSMGDHVDVAAPGVDILSTFPTAKGAYAKLSGTSMATPFVAGLAVLIAAKHAEHGGATPVDTPQAWREHLLRGATDQGAPGRDPEYGVGMINPADVLADLPTPIQPGEPEEIRRFHFAGLEITMPAAKGARMGIDF